MAFGFLKKLLRPASPSASPGGVVFSIERIDTELETLFATEEIDEAQIDDAIVFLGDYINQHFSGGGWQDDPWFGPCIVALRGGGGRFYPALLVEKKRQLGAAFSIAVFLQKLPAKIEEEDRRAIPFVYTAPTNAAMSAKVDAAVAAFRDWWQQRFQRELPLSLIGVRMVDGFLRTQYFVRHLDERLLFAAGYFVGEVGRGLFDGDWIDDPDPTKVSLRYPEIDYKPIGRIFKMMSECPEGEALDEYLRLIPQARRAMKNPLTHEGH